MAPTIKTDVVKAVLKKNGWKRKRTKGSHETWSSPCGSHMFTLVSRGDVKPAAIHDLRLLLKDYPPEWGKSTTSRRMRMLIAHPCHRP